MHQISISNQVHKFKNPNSVIPSLCFKTTISKPIKNTSCKANMNSVKLWPKSTNKKLQFSRNLNKLNKKNTIFELKLTTAICEHEIHDSTESKFSPKTKTASKIRNPLRNRSNHWRTRGTTSRYRSYGPKRYRLAEIRSDFEA